MSWICSQKTEISTNFPIFWTKKCVKKKIADPYSYQSFKKDPPIADQAGMKG
jgi:hypothetical protein